MNPAKLGAKNLWVAQYLYGKPSNTNLHNTAYGAWQYTSQMYFQGTTNLKKNKLDTSIDYNNIFAPTSTPSTSSKAIYRLYNSRNKEHLYTSDANEKTQLPKISKDWKYEGVAWQAPTSGTIVYRVYNPKSGEHIYTKDANEIKVLSTKYGWKKEGTAFYSGGSTPIYRLFNAAAGVGSHFVTKSATERNNLVSRGWKYEGVAWYAK